MDAFERALRTTSDAGQRVQALYYLCLACEKLNRRDQSESWRIAWLEEIARWRTSLETVATFDAERTMKSLMQVHPRWSYPSSAERTLEKELIEKLIKPLTTYYWALSLYHLGHFEESVRKFEEYEKETGTRLNPAVERLLERAKKTFVSERKV